MKMRAEDGLKGVSRGKTPTPDSGVVVERRLVQTNPNAPRTASSAEEYWRDHAVVSNRVKKEYAAFSSVRDEVRRPVSPMRRNLEEQVRNPRVARGGLTSASTHRQNIEAARQNAAKRLADLEKSNVRGGNRK